MNREILRTRLKSGNQKIFVRIAERMGCTWGPAGNVGLLLDYIANELREGRDVTLRAEDYEPTTTESE